MQLKLNLEPVSRPPPPPATPAPTTAPPLSAAATLHPATPLLSAVLPASVGPRPQKHKRLKSEASPKPAPEGSRTLRELAEVSKDQAKATLKRLREGYMDRSGQAYPPAQTNETGCVLVQKEPNLDVCLPLRDMFGPLSYVSF
jgi:hypothetical protein